MTAISDMITVEMTTLTTVNIITAIPIVVINTPASFVINCRISEVAFVFNVALEFGFIRLTGATFVITCVITLVCTVTGMALSCSAATNICCFVKFVAEIRVSGNLFTLCLLVLILTVASVCFISATGKEVFKK